MALLKGHPREKRGRAVSQQQPGESHAAAIGSGFWNNFATSIWNLVLLILRMTVRQHWRQGRQTKCCLLLTLYTTLEWVLQSKLLCRIWVRLCGLSFCDAWQLKSWSQIAAIFSQSIGCNSHVTAKSLLLVSRSGILICSDKPHRMAPSLIYLPGSALHFSPWLGQELDLWRISHQAAAVAGNFPGIWPGNGTQFAHDDPKSH